MGVLVVRSDESVVMSPNKSFLSWKGYLIYFVGRKSRGQITVSAYISGNFDLTPVSRFLWPKFSMDPAECVGEPV